MLQAEEKQRIREAAAEHIARHEMSDGELARTAGINVSYMSAILNGKETVGRDSVVIKDKYYMQLAETIGLQLDKSYWGKVDTREFIEIIQQLEQAKAQGMTKTLICNTGKGKTYAVRKFEKAHPNYTYVITINSLMSMADIIKELLRQMRLEVKTCKALRMYDIIMRFRDLRHSGKRPMLILDEAENMSPATMRMIKGLYDGICENKHASIVLIGTDQLETMMVTEKARGRVAAPQFYRRFKAGIRHIKTLPVEKAFVPFFEQFGVKDMGLRKLLCELCENYGELHDYLEPALKAADGDGEELTEVYFRRMYNMPR
jgi:DNA transposition AAA+ family ATPase